MLTEFAHIALNCLAQIASFEACFHLQLQTTLWARALLAFWL